MKLKDTLIAWNPGGEIQVGPLAENRKWSAAYRMSGGGCYTEVKSARGDSAKVFALAEFNAIVVRDGVPVSDADREFMKIDEYRDAIASDLLTPGEPDDDPLALAAPEGPDIIWRMTPA
jgi:hypothetical protein